MLIFIQLNVFPNENLMKYGNECTNKYLSFPWSICWIKNTEAGQRNPALGPHCKSSATLLYVGEISHHLQIKYKSMQHLSITRVVFFNCFSFWLSNITIHSLIYIYIYILSCNFLILNCRFIQCQSFLLEILLIYLNI